MFTFPPLAANAQTLPELRCPPTARTSPHVPHPPRTETDDTEIPSGAEVGDLARPVDLNPPVLDLARIPEFALKDAGGAARPRRFAFWGDSHIAAGPMMAQLQQAIRARGETVAAHFLPPTMGRANVRLPALHAYCIGPGWSTALAFKEQDVQAVGPALANRVAAAGPDSYLWIDFRTADLKPQLRGVEIAYRTAQPGTEIAFSVNDGQEAAVPLASEPGAHRLVIHADALLSTLKLRVTHGQLVLQGFVLEYDQPPLVALDVFGLPSSTARGWANADPAAIRDALAGEAYDGVVLEYGTNEGNEAEFDRARYAAGLTAALTNMRAVFPQASCVLIGPPDRGVLLPRRGARPRGLDYLKYAKIHAKIADVQGDVAAKFGCVSWNWQDFMGGPGGNYGWAHHDPVLMGADLTHLTRDGYQRSGTALATSLGWAGPDQSVYPR
ncbi:MAG: hypothetical protein WDN08_01150 [Rhizomicrobium sp.]